MSLDPQPNSVVTREAATLQLQLQTHRGPTFTFNSHYSLKSSLCIPWKTARGGRSRSRRQRASTLKLQLLPWSLHLTQTGGLMLRCLCPPTPWATSVTRGHVPRWTSGLMLNSAPALQRGQWGPGNENHRSVRPLQRPVLLWALTQGQVVKKSTRMWPFPIPSDTDPRQADEGSMDALRRMSSVSMISSCTVPWHWSSPAHILTLKKGSNCITRSFSLAWIPWEFKHWWQITKRLFGMCSVWSGII